MGCSVCEYTYSLNWQNKFPHGPKVSKPYITNQVAKTHTDAFPNPTIQDILVSLAGARVFSALDLNSAYWQVEMHSDCDCEEKQIIPYLPDVPQTYGICWGISGGPREDLGLFKTSPVLTNRKSLE